jgi:leucyl-tRNA synthetase
LAKLVPRIAREIETLKFNTAIAALMSFVNLANAAGITRRELEVFLHLLYPFAPHIAEEMWERLGHRRLLARSRWPRSPQAGREEKPSLTIVVQVNGRVRGHFTVQADSSPKRIIARARKLPRVQKYLAGAEVKRVVVVPRRLINFVTTPAR